MKTQSAALAAHRLGTTTLAQCWLVTRADGQVYAFTNLDRDVEYEGRTYVAADGFTASAVEGAANLSVRNMEVSGPLASSALNDADVVAGRWDGALVEVFEVNYLDPTMGRMILAKGQLGSLSTGDLTFKAEQRSLEQKLQQPVGRVCAPTCDATLGDARCGINLVALEVSGTVTASTSRRAFSASAMAHPADYFGGGVVVWDTGLNAGLSMEVLAFDAGAFDLALRMPYDIAVGDTFTASPGCRKRRDEDCRDKFANVVNFRGFPDLPGNNRILGSAGLKSA